RSKKYKAIFESYSSGSAQSQLPIHALKEIPIIFPSFSEQRAIAGVLSSLDDKIELLCEQNKTLEATAQAIFKEWFVNFNFPGATGKMIDSELGEIPEGWRVEKITNILDFIKGSEPGAANYTNEKADNDYVPFYRVQDISQYGNIPNIYVEEKLLRGKIFNHDDILVSLDGTIGRVFIGGAGGHSGGIRRVVGKHDFIKKSLILCFLKSPKFQSDLESFSGAETTIKHASGAIEHIRFVLQDDICKKFGVAFDPLFQKIVSNISQVQILSKLRDALMPKLMKGEVRVKEFDK
ncbi:MAG: restriction endonuclease subunit S, partial [Candidatus Moranbacteria bacterium]|nr:restriction endonuclease subunit S [Candidatus Moranbacteria bacterium]